jgi:uncharacterized protein YeaO (DUF488 family)
MPVLPQSLSVDGIDGPKKPGEHEMIKIRRVYDKPDPADGVRILVDRLWPRGLSKEAAKVDVWAKNLSPSHELRKWYGHDPEKWEEFKKRYFAEMDGNPADVENLKEQIRGHAVTFLYSSKEERLNNAQALKLYLEMRKGTASHSG